MKLNVCGKNYSPGEWYIKWKLCAGEYLFASLSTVGTIELWSNRSQRRRCVELRHDGVAQAQKADEHRRLAILEEFSLRLYPSGSSPSASEQSIP